jgi:hypothetical protein
MCFFYISFLPLESREKDSAWGQQNGPQAGQQRRPAEGQRGQLSNAAADFGGIRANPYN